MCREPLQIRHVRISGNPSASGSWDTWGVQPGSLPDGVESQPVVTVTPRHRNGRPSFQDRRLDSATFQRRRYGEAGRTGTDDHDLSRHRHLPRAGHALGSRVGGTVSGSSDETTVRSDTPSSAYRTDSLANRGAGTRAGTCGGFRCGHRRRDRLPLTEPKSTRQRVIYRGIIVDSVGNEFDTQATCQVDDRVQQRLRAWVVLVPQVCIELQRVDRSVAEIVERRRADAEVVDCDANTTIV